MLIKQGVRSAFLFYPLSAEERGLGKAIMTFQKQTAREDFFMKVRIDRNCQKG
jgi:hypothetical protein